MGARRHVGGHPAGPRKTTPLDPGGYYVGAELSTPRLGFARITGAVVRSELCRDDSLVAWAAANTMFDVQLGKKERSTVVKLQAALGRNLSNPPNPPNLFLDLPSVRPLPSSVAAVTAGFSSNPGHTCENSRISG